MTRRQKVGNGVERLALSTMMLSIAFVLERVIERMLSGEVRSRPSPGQGLFRRLLRGGVVSSQMPARPSE
jgi:hypothetical protein